MAPWIIEADIVRIEKAMEEAGPAELEKLRLHLLRARANLAAMRGRPAAPPPRLTPRLRIRPAADRPLSF